MKAVLFREHGGPDILSYEDLPEPTIGPEDVLVRVKACALNHLDIWIRQGNPAYPMTLPHVSGSDAAGIVEQVGGHVDSVTVGQRVFVSPGISCWKCDQCLAGRDNLCRSYGLVGAKTHGSYAEYLKVPFRNVLPIPENLSFEQAAAFPLVSVTASHMLFALAGLQHGETVLIMGAGSGVGMHGGPNGEAGRGSRDGDRRVRRQDSQSCHPGSRCRHQSHEGEGLGARQAADRRTRRRCRDRAYRSGGVGHLSGFVGERWALDYLWRDDRGRSEAESPVCLCPPADNQGVLYGHARGIGEGGGTDGAGSADLGDRSDVSTSRSSRGTRTDVESKVFR